jgi:hypothetical protein
MGLVLGIVVWVGQSSGMSALWLVAGGGLAGGVTYVGMGLLLKLSVFTRLPSALLGKSDGSFL